MTRSEFIAALRRGLAGFGAARTNDIIADYESHFDEGLASGRSEEEIAAALGDPARLARELRAEQGFKRWEEQKTPSNLAGAVLALAGLATVDIMFILPFLMGVFATVLGLFAVVLAMLICGVIFSMGSLFPGLAWFGLSGNFSGALAFGLAGVGLIAGGIGLGSLLWLATDWLLQLLVRFGRLHFQLIESVTV